MKFINLIKKSIFYTFFLFTLSACIGFLGITPPPEEPIQYEVGFYFEGNIIETQNIVEGEVAVSPTNITHSCYLSLEDWYIDEELTTPYDFTNAITNDFFLYTEWDISPPKNSEGKYEIKCWQQLQWIAGGSVSASERTNRLGYDYILINDITFPEPGQDGFPEYGFIPIGYDVETENPAFEGVPFTGTFDGDGFTISNLFIDTTHSSWTTPDGIYVGQVLDNDFIGLFGRMDHDDAEVRDLTVALHLTNSSVPYSIDAERYVGGLVGDLQNGVVSNVGVLNGVIRGVSFTGGLIGINNDVAYGYATGNVMGSSQIGGLVGENSGTTIGYALGGVIGNDRLGGLVGQNSSGNITGYANGSVQGFGVIGGLVGENKYGSVVGYAMGEVLGNEVVGGLVGWNDDAITVGYATGKVLEIQHVGPLETTIGGLVGSNNSVVIGYWDIASSEHTNSDGGVGIFSTKNIMLNEKNNHIDSFYDRVIFHETAFVDAFNVETDSSMTWPQLKNFPFPQPTLDSSTVLLPIYTITFNYLGGSGTPTQAQISFGEQITVPLIDIYPCDKSFQGWYQDSQLITAFDFNQSVFSDLTLYAKWDYTPQENEEGKKEIKCWQELQWIAGAETNLSERVSRLSNDYILVNDITFPEMGEDGFPEYGFTPIGYDVGINPDFDGNPFTGTFDGSGFTISNFFINAAYSNWVKPSGIYTGQTLDDEHIGLFGNINYSNAEIKDLTMVLYPVNNSVPNSITGDDYVGGIVGSLRNGSISNVSVRMGKIKGNNRVGGLIGWNEGAVTGYTISEVVGKNNVGGMAGNNRGHVTGYVTGEVSGNSYVGGMAGNNRGHVTGYVTGEISGNSYVGGMAGNNRGHVTGYVTGEISGNSYVGGMAGNNRGHVIGYVTGEVSGNSYVSSLVGENYGTVTSYWDMSSTGHTNSDSGTGVSSTKNIVFTEGIGYTDSSYEREIFHETNFTIAFATNIGSNQTWPQLKDFPFSQPIVDDSIVTLPIRTIIFDYQGGSGIPSQTYSSGDWITSPTATHPCDKDFEGWYQDNFFSTLFDFNQPVFTDMTLYAKWNFTPQENSKGKKEIKCWQELQWIAGGNATNSERTNRLGYDYILVNDIIFPEPGEGGFPEYGFIPIGYDERTSDNNFDGSPFTGTLDGAGFIISNFFINATHNNWTTPGGIYKGTTLDYDSIGLFGTIDHSNAEVRDLRLVLHPINDSVINSINTAGDFVGGAVGFLSDGVVSNVSVEGGKIQGNNYVGGIVGYNVGNIIGYTVEQVVLGKRSIGGMVGWNESNVVGYTMSQVLGDFNIGGLVGYNNGGTITGYATGEVLGNTQVGGLVGNNNFSGIIIGYATGRIFGDYIGNDVVGGLVGQNGGIIIGYSTGSVLGNGNIVGGLVGGNSKTGIVFGYWDMINSRQTNSAGGIGISATKNLSYNSGPPPVYTDDLGTEMVDDDVPIFDITNFTEKFILPEVNQTWPILKDFFFPQITVSDIDNNGVDVILPIKEVEAE